MARKVRSWAGLDVHAAKVIACVVDAESGEMTPPLITSRCSISRSRNSISKRWRARSWCGPTAPALRTS